MGPWWSRTTLRCRSSSHAWECGGSAVRPCTRRSAEAAMTDPRLLSLLHFADSALPTGGYAHSFGLERYCQAGLVRDRHGLERFLLTQLEGATGPCDATAAAGALRALARGDVRACQRLDEELEAMKVVREFREGSRQMGRQTLRVAASLKI